MKKIIFKTIYFIFVFIIACLVMSRMMNQGNADMTAAMEEPSYPIMHLMIDRYPVNSLVGYEDAMKCSYMRDNLTTISSDRMIKFQILKCDQKIDKVSFEVRSLDGSRLVENTEYVDVTESEDVLEGRIVVKDLIDPEREYMLIFILNLEDGRELRYYTRLIQTDNYNIEEKLKYVMNFHDKTFQKENANELSKYLESNSSGDNSSYNHVNIHSSFNQVTWGDLNIERITEPIIDIHELAVQTGYFTLNYMVQIRENGQKAICAVEERYRIRYTPDRIYLLDYERDMEQIFDESAQNYANDKINLGIASKNLQLVESDAGNVFAFVSPGKLYSYDVISNKIAKLYSFYADDYTDERIIKNRSDIKILSVDEAGNVEFIVYGYMNRGRHEGHVGVTLYSYNSMLNTIDENLFIDYDKSYEILKNSIEKLAYMNKSGHGYIMLDGAIYQFNQESHTGECVVENLVEGSYCISNDNQMIVWQSEGDLYTCTEMTLFNLYTGKKGTIKASSRDYLLPLGFMGEDLIYGIAHKSDVYRDITGTTKFPMYSIRIQDDRENVLKNYEEPNIYVSSCSVNNNQITLYRMTMDENGAFVETTPDQIMNTEEISVGSNIVQLAVTDNLETIVQIQVKNEIKAKNIKILTPKEVLFEGNRDIEFTNESELPEQYFVYTVWGLQDVYMNPSNAINSAYNNAGIVVNESGDYIWLKGNRATKNQIMAITDPVLAENGNSLAICLDSILTYEGVSTNSQSLLSRGQNIQEILQSNIPNAQILELMGCNLDAVLYYVNRDLPVLVMLDDNAAVLITGFNEKQIVVMDPEKGSLYKIGMDEAELWFAQNGHAFITYIRSEE